MPKSQNSTLFYDAGFTWTCGICGSIIKNKSNRGINMMKRLHFKANPDCKSKTCAAELKRKIHGAGAKVVKGSYDEAVAVDSLNTIGAIKLIEDASATNLNVEHNSHKTH